MRDIEYFNAYLVYSYIVCKREAWFYYHHIEPPSGNVMLELGKLIHLESYKRERKEILIDNFLKFDLVRNEIIAEVKKSSKNIEAARLQLAYYLYYLKHEKNIEVNGVLLFPRERKKENLHLTPELESKLEFILVNMKEDLNKPFPPKPSKTRFCKVCSFFELCWI